MNFLDSCFSILVLMCLAIPGYVLVKLKVLKEEHIFPLVTVLLYVNQPFITINSFITKEFTSGLMINITIVFFLAALTQIVMFLVARLIFSYDKIPSRRNMYVFATAVGNVGFIGIPICNIFMPGNTEATLYISVYLIAFNLIAWTLGIYMVTGDKKYISLKKAAINPPVIALIIALPLFFFKVKLPDIVVDCVGYMAIMNTPLAMVVLGMRFALVRFRDMFKGASVYLVSFLKLVVTPLIVYLVLLPFKLDKILVMTMVIVSAMPTANMVLMMAEKFGGDTEAAAKSIMNTTVFSILILPLVMLLPM